MAENKEEKEEKKDEKPLWAKALHLLDLTNDVEQIGNLYGVSEADRNDSRLNNVVTGEKRPLSHTATEGGAWLTTNVGIPILTAGLGKIIGGGGKVASAGGKAASHADDVAKGLSKGAKAAKAISKVDDAADAVEAASKTQKIANAGRKETKALVKEAKKEVKQAAKEGLKELDEAGNIDKGIKRGRYIEASDRDKSKVLKAAKKETKEAELGGKVLNPTDPIAKTAQKGTKADTEKALTELHDKYYDMYHVRNNKGKYRKPEEVEKLIKADSEYAKEAQQIINGYFNSIASEYSNVKGIEAGATSLLLPNYLHMAAKKDDGGSFAKDYLPKAFDKDIEIGVGKSMWNNLLNFFDLDGDDPDKYPMDKINALISAINDSEDGKGRFWNPRQIEGLSDQEKINLIKMISNHKFDNEKYLSSDTKKTPGYELRKAYSSLFGTNKEEEKK